MCEVAQGDGKEKERMESGDLAKSTTCGHYLDVGTEGQGESKKIPGFPIRVSESLNDFINRNRKVRGGGLIEENMMESVLELFSWRCWAYVTGAQNSQGRPRCGCLVN